jgi:hypothetical protein
MAFRTGAGMVIAGCDRGLMGYVAFSPDLLDSLGYADGVFVARQGSLDQFFHARAAAGWYYRLSFVRGCCSC